MEAERERARRERDRDQAALLARQEQALDQVAERHALAAKRQQEAVERERRQKEAEKAKQQKEVRLDCCCGVLRPRRKASMFNFTSSLIDTMSIFISSQIVQALQSAREEQIRSKERVLALQAQQEKEEFQRILEAQTQRISAEAAEQQARESMRRNHAGEVRDQIRERELVRQAERQAFFHEGVVLDEEARERRRRLDAIKQRKLEELQKSGVDPKYVVPVKRFVADPSRTIPA